MVGDLDACFVDDEMKSGLLKEQATGNVVATNRSTRTIDETCKEDGDRSKRLGQWLKSVLTMMREDWSLTSRPDKPPSGIVAESSMETKRMYRLLDCYFAMYGTQRQHGR